MFLDEPTTGLDPQARRDIWGLVDMIRSQGRTVILTTHYMEEAHQLADRVVILDQGKVVGDGTPDALIRQCAPNQVIRVGGQHLSKLANLGWVPVHDVETDEWHRPLSDSHQPLESILAAARNQGAIL